MLTEDVSIWGRDNMNFEFFVSRIFGETQNFSVEHLLTAAIQFILQLHSELMLQLVLSCCYFF